MGGGRGGVGGGGADAQDWLKPFKAKMVLFGNHKRHIVMMDDKI